MSRGFVLFGMLMMSATLGCSAAPNAALKPTGDGWHCTNAYVQRCARSPEVCAADNAAQDKGKGIFRCEPQPQAYCYTWIKNGKADFDCLSTDKECDSQREIRMTLAEGEAYRGAKYSDWSGCGVW